MRSGVSRLLDMISGLCLIILCCCILHIEFNSSSSMPIGLYYKTSKTTPKHGDFVKVCLPMKIAEAGLANYYIDKGHCPANASPLIKEVIAVPGDTVQATKKYLIVNGVEYFAPVHPKDSSGKAITRFIHNGVFKHTKQYWLYGFNNKNLSWDSRYFGGVDTKYIMGIYKLL